MMPAAFPIRPLLAGWFLAVASLAPAAEALPGEAAEKPVLRHPVETVDVATFLPAGAAEMPHVLFVNVGQALDAKAFADAVAYMRLRWTVTVWTNSADAVAVAGLLADQEASRTAHAKHAVLVVYVVKDDAMASYLSQPGTWALINLRGLDRDGPEPLLLTKRLRQMFIKGLCFAAGVGVNADPYCAMYAESFTPPGMDKTSATLGPFAYGPLTMALQLLAVQDLFVPVMQ